MSAERDAIIHRWLAAKKAAAQWAAEERMLRDYIAQQLGYFPDEPARSIKPGTHRMDLGRGYGLKLVTGETTSIKEGPEFDRFLTACRDPSTSGGKSIEATLVRWKASLQAKEYENMRSTRPDVVAVLKPALEIKPKAPTLELEEPKA